MKKIHPTAIIEEGAEIGSDVEVGAYSHVGPDVNIGNNCILKSHVIIDGHTTIGEENMFFPTSYIGGEPQDLKYKGAPTEVVIGDNNTFRECVTVNRATND